MNTILGLLVGLVIGWGAYALLRMNAARGLRTSLLIGLVGGGMGMQLAQMLTAAPSMDSQLDVFALIVAASASGACLIIANMASNHRG